MKSNIREITTGAILAALSVVIAMFMPKVYIPPFSATLTLHTPVIVGFFISPVVAVFAVIGSVVGFLFVLPPVIAARAATHLVFVIVGSYMVKKGARIPAIFVITAAIHALLEALVVLPFGYDISFAFITVGLGTILHYALDFAIALPILARINKSAPSTR